MNFALSVLIACQNELLSGFYFIKVILMKTYIECLPCFFRQAIDACKKAELSEKETKKIIVKAAKAIRKISMDVPPPAVAYEINSLVNKASGKKDFYEEEKKKSNDAVLSIYLKCMKKIEKSKDPLLAAVELAIAGNIIDFGIMNKIDIDKEVSKIINSEEKMLKHADKKYFAYTQFAKCVEKSAAILFLGDNAGEIVFDKMLIETIKKKYPRKRVIYAVKSKPILNDSLKEDAVYCGLDSYAEIITSGSVIPGTIAERCSKQFTEYLSQAGMVISKGQGNFESFISDKPVFYLFMAKCPVVANEIGCALGTINLYYNGK